MVTADKLADAVALVAYGDTVYVYPATRVEVAREVADVAEAVGQDVVFKVISRGMWADIKPTLPGEVYIELMEGAE